MFTFADQTIHPETLEEKTPEFILPYYQWAIHTLTSYGWYILCASILSLYFWNQIKSKVTHWRDVFEECKFAAETKKNPDLLQARQDAIDRARKRMQEDHDKQAVVHAERMKELEEKRTLERLQRVVGVGTEGNRLGSAADSEPSTSKKSTFKPEYNPLMGAGASGGYRPPKRGCPGGGCGKK